VLAEFTAQAAMGSLINHQSLITGETTLPSESATCATTSKVK